MFKSIKKKLGARFPQLKHVYHYGLGFLNAKKIRSANDSVECYFISKEGLSVIQPLSSCINVKALPDELIINQGTYFYHGQCFECKTPGIYRFSKPQIQNSQRVILAQKQALPNALFLSLIAIRGNRDDWRGFQNMENSAKNRFLNLTCGPLSHLVVNLLERNNIRARVVFTHTLDEKNSYNNGHAMVEVFDTSDNKFKLIDVDKKCYFSSDEGNVLNLIDLCEKIFYQNSFNIHYMQPFPLVDWSSFIEAGSGFNYQFIEHALNWSRCANDSLHQRICQIPMIVENGISYRCAWDDSLITKSHPQQKDKEFLLERQSFREKFYRSENNIKN